MLMQLLINGIIFGSIIAIMGLGYSLYYNVTKIFHIAYASLYTVSIYFFYTFYSLWHFNIWVSVIITMIATSVVGVIIEILVYHPILKRSGSLSIVLIASIGVMIVLTNLISLIYGNEVKVISTTITKTVKFNGIIITYPQFYQIFFSSIIMILIVLIIKNTSLGMVFRAIKNDENLALVMGINVMFYRLVSMVLSSMIVSVAGILIAVDIGFDPYVGMTMFLSGVVAFIIGGIDRFESPILGGFFLGVLESLVIWKFSTRWQEAIVFVILIVFLIFKPYGIMGKRRREV